MNQPITHYFVSAVEDHGDLSQAFSHQQASHMHDGLFLRMLLLLLVLLLVLLLLADLHHDDVMEKAMEAELKAMEENTEKVTKDLAVVTERLQKRAREVGTARSGGSQRNEGGDGRREEKKRGSRMRGSTVNHMCGHGHGVGGQKSVDGVCHGSKSGSPAEYENRIGSTDE